METLFHYFPLIAVAVVAANLAIYWHRAARLSAENPGKRSGYRRIVKVLAIYFGGLTVLWAAGAMFGFLRVVGMPSASSVMESYRPTVFDWFFLGAWVIVFLRFSIWLYAGGGADDLVEHRDIFGSFPESASAVKILWALALVASAASAVHRFRL